jgi:hypothetical protein
LYVEANTDAGLDLRAYTFTLTGRASLVAPRIWSAAILADPPVYWGVEGLDLTNNNVEFVTTHRTLSFVMRGRTEQTRL